MITTLEQLKKHKKKFVVLLGIVISIIIFSILIKMP